MFKKTKQQQNKVKLQVKEVYKIFGEKPEMALKYVLDGISKTDLFDEYQTYSWIEQNPLPRYLRL